MIPRYSRPEMTAIWSDSHRYEIWLRVEILALEGMVREGIVPVYILDAVKSRAVCNPARADELEREVKHDVIAFLTSIVETVGPEARYLHRGMTSSDLVDTSLAVQLSEASQLIVDGTQQVLSVLKELAVRYKYSVCIGRSHGVHAEPTTFGIKVLSWYAEIKRWLRSFEEAVREIRVGKIAGAVGTYHSISPKIEEFVLSSLGLRAEDVPSQIVHRDRHARFFSTLSLLGASVERIAVELRHLQRTEVREVEEGFSKGQKGSSAMPHKKNPITSENLCGLVRLLRGYALAAVENVALWHERDISHSSVERVICPDACIIADFMLHRLRALLAGLVVHEDKMLENLNLLRGTVFSGTTLILLADSGMTREQAYALVQQHALAALAGGATFQERMSSDPAVAQALGTEGLAQAFAIERHTAHVGTIFERVLGS